MDTCKLHLLVVRYDEYRQRVVKKKLIFYYFYLSIQTKNLKDAK
jgi:hypothetical protein